MSLIAHNLSTRFANRVIFKQLSFKLQSGQCLVVRGVNGSGKTTLLNQLSTLVALHSGEVKYFDEPIDTSSNLKTQMIYISHKVYLKENLSVEDNLKWLALIHGKNLSINCSAILERANLAILLEQKVHQLSEGQKKRLLLSQLFFPAKLLWLLDEPLTCLDEKSKVWFEKLLANHCKFGGMAVISTHQKITYPHQTLQLDDFNVS